MNWFFHKKKTGLALGGGAVLGAAHIGVLKAMDELNLKVHFIAGTSIGALVASLYAFGKTWEEIADIAADLAWLEVSGLSLSKMGLLSNKKLADWVRKVLGPVRIEDARIPLALVATDIRNGDEVVLKSGPVDVAVQASTCIPGVYIPVKMGERLLVDGGVAENVPILPLKEMGARPVIAVDLLSRHPKRTPTNIVDILINSFNFTLMRATRYETREADILLEPDLSGYNLTDMDQIPDLIRTGYGQAKPALKKLVS